MDIWTMAVPLIGALLGIAGSWLVAERKLRTDYRLQFQAERVARELLSSDAWQLRSFDRIQRHLGGFEPEELRRILVRAGALRFEAEDGTEMWGLLDRNREKMRGD